MGGKKKVLVGEVPPGTAMIKDKIEKMSEEIKHTGYVLFGNPLLGTILAWIGSHIGQILLWGTLAGIAGISLWGAWQTATNVVEQIRKMAPLISVILVVMMLMMMMQPITALMSTFKEAFGERGE